MMILDYRETKNDIIAEYIFYLSYFENNLKNQRTPKPETGM